MNTLTAELTISIGRGYPRLLYATLMIGHVSQGLAFTAFVAALPQMAIDLGTQGALIAQMTMSLAALGIMLGALSSGWILARTGTRTMLIGSLLVYGASGAAGLLGGGTFLLLGSRLVLGFVSACLTTVCVWGIAAEFQAERRARAIGVAHAAGNCAALAGNLIGGYLAQHGGWPLAFIQYPLFALSGLLLAWPSLRQVRPTRPQTQETHQPFLLRLLPFYLLCTALLAVMFIGSIQFPFLLQEDRITDPATRSLVLAAITLVGAATSFLYGSLVKLLGADGAVRLGFLSMALGLGISACSSLPAAAALGAALMGVYVGTVGPYVYHVVTERTDALARSHAIGLLNTFFFLGAFLNPLLFAPFVRLIGLRHFFLWVAAAMVCMAAVSLMLQRSEHPQPVPP